MSAVTERKAKFVKRIIPLSVWENLQFATLILLIVGQCTVGSLFYVGQGAYLLANIVSVSRCFALDRPISDKIKDCACLGITLGLLAIKFLGGIKS